MVSAIIKKLYRKFIPFSTREKIGRTRQINASKRSFERQEAYFKRHITDFTFDNARKTDILRIFSLLKKNGTTIFPEMNLLIHEKYFARELKIEKDSTTGLFYILVDNKKLFYKKSMNENSIRHLFNCVSVEQDYASPHRYLTNDNYFVGVMDIDNKQVNNGDSFGVSEGDVVVDVGAAEGNFALSVIEKASKVYIVESDAEWCEALKQTFSPYKEKVEIIQKYLSNISDDNNITLTDLIKNYNVGEINFLKMDIEGCEIQALRGGTINDVKFVNIDKMAICVYHRPTDEVEISNFVSRYGYKFYLTEGYMFFPDGNNLQIRKSILRAFR